MKVYISADIEGITGLVSWNQCGRADEKHWDFAFARRMMTHDVNAAVKGARSAGATEIVIKDSHGNSKSLLIDELESGVRLISGHGSGVLGMMEGLDDSFDCAMLIGYHAMAGTTAGVMEHTITGGVHRLEINGFPAGEMALSAGVAGAFGVPIVTVSSDEAGCVEASALVTGVATATVKKGLGRYMAELLHPRDTANLIFEAAHEGVTRARSIDPWIPVEPTHIAVEFNRSEEADFCAKLLRANRIDAYTIEVSYPSYLEAHQACWNLMALSANGLRAGD